MILASASPRRLELLRDLGFEPRVCPADIDEARLPSEAPRDLVERLARGKARAARAGLGEAAQGELLLAADTIVWDDAGDVFGKPADAADARRMLRRLSGATHHVSTGVCLLAAGTEPAREIAFVETTDVTFYELTDAEVDAYVASGEPLDKAGAYGIQGLGRLLVRGISGDYLNVVGLPVGRTVRAMGELGAARHGGVPLVGTLLGGPS